MDRLFGKPNLSPVEQQRQNSLQQSALNNTLNQVSGNGNAPVGSKPLPAVSSMMSQAPQAQITALRNMNQTSAGPTPGQVAASNKPPMARPTAPGAAPAFGANMATLVSPTGERKAVAAGSQEAQNYFGQGYTLEGASKPTGSTPPPIPPPPAPSSSNPNPPGNAPSMLFNTAQAPGNAPTNIPGNASATTTNPYLSSLQNYQKQLLATMTPTQQEKDLQQQIADLHGATQLGIQNQAGQGRGIPLSLVQGAQEKLLNQGNIQEQTLQQQLANLIAQRTGGQAQLGKQAEFEGQLYKDYQDQSAPKAVGDNLLKFDPVTGKVETLYSAPGKAAEGFTLGEGQARYDANGNLLASGATKAADNPTSVKEYEYAKANGYTGSFTDFQNQSGAGGSKQPSSVQEYEYAVGQGYKGTYTDFQKEMGDKTSSAEMLKLKGLGQSFTNSSDYLMNYIDTHWNLAGTLNPQEIARVDAAKQNLVDIIGRLRSGAVISDQEAKRFSDLLPSATDTDKTAHFKMDQLKASLQPVLGKIESQSNQSTNFSDTNSSNLPADQVEKANNIWKSDNFSSAGGQAINSPVIIPSSSNLAYKNNNPGNLRFAGQSGASQGAGGFAQFSSPQAGFQALVNQISLDTSRGHTLGSFIQKYAPSSENNTGQYISQVSSWLGIPPQTPLSQINPVALGKAMARKESSSTFA